MLRKRMLNPEIWEDEHFGNLKDKGKLLFIACMSSADDDGRLSGNPSNLRAIAFRFEEISIKEVEKIRNEISNCMKNFIVYEVEGCEYIQFNKWLQHQIIREDRKKESKLPSCPQGVALLQPNAAICPPKLSKGKLREDKLSKDKVNKDLNNQKKDLSINILNKNIDIWWDYFILKTKRKFKLKEEHKTLIKKRMEEGYTIEQFKKAVDNFVSDAWEGRASNMDLLYCIGKQRDKPDHFEKWLNYVKRSNNGKGSNQFLDEETGKYDVGTTVIEEKPL